MFYMYCIIVILYVPRHVVRVNKKKYLSISSPVQSLRRRTESITGRSNCCVAYDAARHLVGVVTA